METMRCAQLAGAGAGSQASRTRTRDLERLVETYREAREVLTDDELKDYRIRVVGVGEIRLVDYFRRIARVDESTTERIIFGGATFEQSFGQGFKLKFYDRVKTLPVYLYVSPSLMREYRYRRYVAEIVAKIPAHRYVTVYAIGHLQQQANGRGFDLVIDHLRSLALLLGPAIETAPSGDSEDRSDIGGWKKKCKSTSETT